MSTTRTKPTVGQTLYSMRIRDRHSGDDPELIPVEVISVGRKYFKALPVEYKDKPDLAIQYHIDDWTEVSNYSPDWRLYLSTQERFDEKDFDDKCRFMRALFTGYTAPDISLSTLRRCHELIVKDQTLRGYDK